MATLFEFRTNAPARRSASNASRSSGSTSAEIVFFPGVRYEQWDDASQEAKPKRRPKKRDKLELRD